MKRALFLILLLAGPALGQKPPLGSQILPDAPGNRGLVGYWLMNEWAGSRISDLSRSHIDGTLSATSGWVNGCVDCTLDGREISIPSTMLQSSGTMVWRYNCIATPAEYGRLFATANSNSNFVLFRDGSSTQNVYFTINSSDVLFTATGMWSFGWHTMAVTWDDTANTRSLYFDGLLVRTDTTAFTWPTLETPLYLGGRGVSGNSTAGALLDYWAIFNRVLSAAEITSFYQDRWAGVQQDPLTMYATAGGAPPATSPVPVFQHHYEQMRAGIPVALPILAILSMAFLMRRSNTCDE